MDSDMDSSFMLMRWLAGPATAFVGFFVSLLVLSPLVLYLVARWRAQRGGGDDPHLGLKFAMHYFGMIAFQVALGSAALLVYILLADDDHKGNVVRAAFGLLIPSLFVFGMAYAFLRRTNDALMTGVRRLFVGYNLITTGIVAFVGLVVGCEALLAKGGGDGAGYVGAALVVVYCTAWGLLALRFSGLVHTPPQMLAPPAAFVAPVAVPAPMHRD